MVVVGVIGLYVRALVSVSVVSMASAAASISCSPLTYLNDSR